MTISTRAKGSRQPKESALNSRIRIQASSGPNDWKSELRHEPKPEHKATVEISPERHKQCEPRPGSAAFAARRDQRRRPRHQDWQREYVRSRQHMRKHEKIGQDNRDQCMYRIEH